MFNGNTTATIAVVYVAALFVVFSVSVRYFRSRPTPVRWQKALRRSWTVALGAAKAFLFAGAALTAVVLGLMHLVG